MPAARSTPATVARRRATTDQSARTTARTTRKRSTPATGTATTTNTTTTTSTGRTKRSRKINRHAGNSAPTTENNVVGTASIVANPVAIEIDEDVNVEVEVEMDDAAPHLTVEASIGTFARPDNSDAEPISPMSRQGLSSARNRGRRNAIHPIINPLLHVEHSMTSRSPTNPTATSSVTLRSPEDRGFSISRDMFGANWMNYVSAPQPAGSAMNQVSQAPTAITQMANPAASASLSTHSSGTNSTGSSTFDLPTRPLRTLSATLDDDSTEAERRQLAWSLYIDEQERESRQNGLFTAPAPVEAPVVPLNNGTRDRRTAFGTPHSRLPYPAIQPPSPRSPSSSTTLSSTTSTSTTAAAAAIRAASASLFSSRGPVGMEPSEYEIPWLVDTEAAEAAFNEGPTGANNIDLEPPAMGSGRRRQSRVNRQNHHVVQEVRRSERLAAQRLRDSETQARQRAEANRVRRERERQRRDRLERFSRSGTAAAVHHARNVRDNNEGPLIVFGRTGGVEVHTMGYEALMQMISNNHSVELERLVFDFGMRRGLNAEEIEKCSTVYQFEGVLETIGEGEEDAPCSSKAPPPARAPGKNTSCIVCLTEFADGEQIRALKCSHDFHMPCIDRWLQTSSFCPLCRKDHSSTDRTSSVAHAATATSINEILRTFRLDVTASVTSGGPTTTTTTSAQVGGPTSTVVTAGNGVTVELTSMPDGSF